MVDQANVSCSQAYPSCMPNSNAPNKANGDCCISERYQGLFFGSVNNAWAFFIVSCWNKPLPWLLLWKKSRPSQEFHLNFTFPSQISIKTELGTKEEYLRMANSLKLEIRNFQQKMRNFKWKTTLKLKSVIESQKHPRSKVWWFPQKSKTKDLRQEGSSDSVNRNTKWRSVMQSDCKSKYPSTLL